MNQEESQQYTTEIGDVLCIWITGCIDTYIAQVVTKEPLCLKVTESGPYSKLKHGDFTIKEIDSAILQRDAHNDTCIYLTQQQDAGRKIISGLKVVNVNDNRLREILPT